MATRYPVKLAITLKPVHHQQPLQVRVGINDNLAMTDLRDETTIHFEFEAAGSCQLVVELPDKKDQEAVIIERLDFFGIQDSRFAWLGVYRPNYPEPWATQQRSQGSELKSELTDHTYLGWPGQWTLTFEVPVFTWIHKIQNLGWIYS